MARSRAIRLDRERAAVCLNVGGQLTIDGTNADTSFLTGISARANRGSTGNGGDVVVNAGALAINPNGEISADTFGAGKGGNVAVTAAGMLSIDGTSSTTRTGISAGAAPTSTGDAGNVVVNAGNLQLVNDGLISAETAGTGSAGRVTVGVA